jgi:hypothetical protein
MDTPERDFPLGDIRVSDAERDLAVAELSRHYQDGRLTIEEFNDRAGQASEARTGDELHALFADLPVGGIAPRPPAPVAPSAVVPRYRPPRYRTGLAFLAGFAVVSNVASGLTDAATGQWSSAGTHVFPALIFGVIFVILIRPLLRSWRR